MKSKKIVVGNWKMEPHFVADAARLFMSVKKTAEKLTSVKTIVAPPFVYIHDLKKKYKGENISLAGQDVFTEMGGAFTGEVSPLQLMSVGAEYCIIGHSERRKLGETDSIVAEKVQSALKVGLTAIVCVGEDIRDQSGAYLDFVANQLRATLSKVQKKNIRGLIVAYEPVWAIGKNDALNTALIQEMAIFIRKILSDLFGQEETSDVPVLYGGAISGRNAEDIMRNGGVQGLLVGHESLNVESFREILKIVEKV